MKCPLIDLRTTAERVVFYGVLLVGLFVGLFIVYYVLFHNSCEWGRGILVGDERWIRECSWL